MSLAINVIHQNVIWLICAALLLFLHHNGKYDQSRIWIFFLVFQNLPLLDDPDT